METFERHGLTFTVRDGGPRNGEAVVLLHGFPQTAECWREVEPLLHHEGLRTLAPDQRGYSEGACPTATSAYRIEELVADVVALLDAAGIERAHVVGHDWGGAVAWVMATQHPERVMTLTVLSTPHPAALAEARRSPAQLLSGWYRVAFQIPRLPERLLAGRVGALMKRARVPGAALYGRRLATAQSLRGPINWYRANRSLGARLVPGPVTVPTTYVWGSRDPALRRVAAESTQNHVRAHYHFVELLAGHWLPEKEPARVAQEIIRRSR